jgi:hypothetical protein
MHSERTNAEVIKNRSKGSAVSESPQLPTAVETSATAGRFPFGDTALGFGDAVLGGAIS